MQLYQLQDDDSFTPVPPIVAPEIEPACDDLASHPLMARTWDRTIRAAQRQILEPRYPDYTVPRHGAFVDQYNVEIERARFTAWCTARLRHHSEG
jgi:hypothetical protein